MTEGSSFVKLRGMTPILILTPLGIELKALKAALASLGAGPFSETEHDGIRVSTSGDGMLDLAAGGLGKVQFALTAQHLMRELTPRLVIGAGAAGALNSTVRPLDIVVSESVIEHDFTARMVKSPLPKFESDAASVTRLKRHRFDDFKVHFGAIASGDEDVIDEERRTHVLEKTGALACAWEGAGLARAAKFQKTPFVEIRCITDGADSNAYQDFKKHMDQGMLHLAKVLLTLS